MQTYSDPRRANDPHALPDVEVWQANVWRADCAQCGAFDIPEPVHPGDVCCPSCGKSPVDACGPIAMSMGGPLRKGFFWQSCFPGCMPDSDPNGPFDTEEEAIADAQSDAPLVELADPDKVGKAEYRAVFDALVDCECVGRLSRSVYDEDLALAVLSEMESWARITREKIERERAQ